MPPHGGWTELQVKYMEWLSLPSDEDMGEKGKGLRNPPTITALAKVLGVHRDTLYDWKQIPGFEEALDAISERTMDGLGYKFNRVMSARLLQPDKAGYDRVFTAYVRYVKPILSDHKFNKDWERIVPVLAGISDNILNMREILVEEADKLPLEQNRELVQLLRRVAEFSHTEKAYSIGRNVSVLKQEGEDEPEPAQQLPALPAPSTEAAAVVRYDPQQGMRKPFRKPKGRV